MPLPPLRPILAALRRHALMPALIALQICVACAILLNAAFELQRQVAPLLVDDGIPPGRLLLVDQLVSREGMWRPAQVRAGADALRALPGVEAVAPALGLPMKQSMSFVLRTRSPSGVVASASGFVGEGLREALGLELVQGRDFTPAEHFDLDLSTGGVDIPPGTPVILTEALARHYFPDGDALGGRLAQPDDSGYLVVVGVVRHLLRYQLDALDAGQAEFSLLLPGRIASVPVLTYAVRTDPAQRGQVREAALAALAREFGGSRMPGLDPIVDAYETLRAAAFRPRRAALWLLGTVIAVMSVVTAVGIAGLSAYWVEQRRRTIGIHRALGARRGDIVRHFLAENAVVVGAGLLPGMVAAYAINQWLMREYEIARLPLAYLPLGALALWLLGLCAAYGPARRAAAVAPAVATRGA